MNRANKLTYYFNHPHYKRLINQLNEAELSTLNDFLDSVSDVKECDYERAVNRWFLDVASKPKRWAIMMELALLCK